MSRENRTVCEAFKNGSQMLRERIKGAYMAMVDAGMPTNERYGAKGYEVGKAKKKRIAEAIDLNLYLLPEGEKAEWEMLAGYARGRM